MPKQTVEYLVVAPHPDDAELGMGGTIVKLLAAGKRLAVLDMTSGEPTPFGTPAKRRRETAASNTALGLKVRLNLGLPNRALEATLAARVKVAEVYRTLRPRVLFIPYWRDAHPDHLAASRLATDARFHAKLTKTSMKGEPHYAERVIYYYCDTFLNLNFFTPTASSASTIRIGFAGSVRSTAATSPLASM